MLCVWTLLFLRYHYWSFVVITDRVCVSTVGGLRSPVRGGAYQKPLGKPERCELRPFSDSSVQQWMGPGQESKERTRLTAEPKRYRQRVGKVEEVKEENDTEEEMVLRKESCFAPSPPLYFHSPPPESHKPTEQELRKLERGQSSLSHSTLIVTMS